MENTILKRYFKMKTMLFLFIVLFVSCTDYLQNENDTSAKRLFSPTNISAYSSSDNVIVRWTVTPNTAINQLDVSEDSLLFQNIVRRYEFKVIPGDTTIYKTALGYINGQFMVTELKPKTNYSFRIRTYNKDADIPVSLWSTVFVKRN